MCYQITMWETKPTTSKPNNVKQVCPKHGCAMTLLLVSYVCDECSPPGTVKQAVAEIKAEGCVRTLYTVSSNPKANVDGYKVYDVYTSAVTRAKAHAAKKGKNYYVYEVKVESNDRPNSIDLSKATSEPEIVITLTP